MNIKKWTDETIRSEVKKALPVLSFPCVQLTGVSVRELVSDSEAQARGMKAVADRVDSAAAVSLMDLSVEAEAFGAKLHMSENEVPTVTGAIVTDEDEAASLEIPEIGAGRTGVYVDAIRKASKLITDRPVFAGTIGPFSLAGRLMDVTEIMVECYDEPELVHAVLEKASIFLIKYAEALRDAGAQGIVMAEPLAGLLSPALASEFSNAYVKKIIDSVRSDEFAVIYHNCGSSVPRMAKEIYSLGASGYHFGDAIRMADMLRDAPDDVLIMGNVSPAMQFLGGTPESIRQNTLEIMNECCVKPNFVISSGCDIPPMTPWENIDAFFAAVKEFYTEI
ncbi:MAG: uroporphyrinogen decarboxylase family protein [Eubacteriales bacterium]|nr:uroporphyrinogen decarboxylase family protein [Eubacteriales bacterium]